MYSLTAHHRRAQLALAALQHLDLDFVARLHEPQHAGEEVGHQYAVGRQRDPRQPDVDRALHRAIGQQALQAGAVAGSAVAQPHRGGAKGLHGLHARQRAQFGSAAGARPVR